MKKLYDHRISIYRESFQVFQQVAILNKINLKELVGIEFKKNFVNDKILNYIYKYFPNVAIKII